MNGSLARFRPVARLAPAVVSWFALAVAQAAPPPETPVDQGPHDPRLKGISAPKGFRVEVVAAEEEVGPTPIAMAFDDRGSLLVAGWVPADRTFDVMETIHAYGGESARVRRRRKTTSDVVRRLADEDDDGVFETSEVVLDGAEMPAGLLVGKKELLLACVGRLERWGDEDGDGRYETRTVLADGFPGVGPRGLSGITLGVDGWLYLATGGGPEHVVGAEGRRVDVERSGAIFRCRPDGSQLHPFATGLADPHGGVAFDSAYQPFLADDDQEDGSKFQGVRLIAPAEDGDYGWRSRPDGSADFDRAAVDGEKPGTLPAVARIGRGTPNGLAIYQGASLPKECQDLILYPDQSRHVVRGYKARPKGGTHGLEAETTLLAGDRDFHPKQVVVGPDEALYVLDARDDRGDDARPWSQGKPGRIYRMTWVGEGKTPAPAAKPRDAKTLASATVDQLIPILAGDDLAEADRAQRELVARGPASQKTLIALLANRTLPLHARLLGLQGARQSWDEGVEAAMVQALGDARPDVRRLAVQALAWEPKSSEPQLVARLAPLLGDPDARVAREAVLAIGRHADNRPGPSAVILVRRLFADPGMDPTVRDGYLRALERLGDAGVEELAVAVRTKHGTDREKAIALWTALRSAPAAERLPNLILSPDLTGPERTALVRHYLDFPASIAMPTQGLADWLIRHPEADSSAKIAVLDVCRLAGNPASALVLRLLDDEDEATRLAAIEVAARSRPPGSMAKLADRLKQPGQSAAERLAIVRALGEFGPSAFAAIQAAYPRAADDPAYAVTSLRALAESDRAKAMPAIEAALVGASPNLHAEAIRLLGRTPEGSVVLAKALLARKIGRDDLPAVLAHLGRWDGDHKEVARARAEVEKAARGVLAVDRSDLRARVEHGGDPWKGLGLFFGARAGQGCAGCHAPGGSGEPVGPVLADAMKSTPGTDALIESILEPSKRISEGFETLRLTLKGGQVASGIEVGGDAESISIRDSSGRVARYPLGEVSAQDRSPTSLMPGTLVDTLTTAEVADLVAFLRNPPAPEAIRHGPTRIDRVLAIGPMEMGADKLRVPLNRIDPARALPGQDGVAMSWGPLEASEAGAFDLRGQFGHRPGRAYVAAEIRSEADQDAALRFAVDGAARVYLNGARVADVPGCDPTEIGAAFASPRPGTVAPMPGLARLPLRDGWNLVVVAIDRAGSGSARAAFEVASPRPVEVRAPRPSAPTADTAASPTPGRTR